MEEPSPAPRRPRRRSAIFAFVGGLLAIAAFAAATSGGGASDRPSAPAAPASFEIQGVQDEGNSMRRHRGRDCPNKHKREREQESGDAGV
jgi:hypothetical protein